MSYAALRSDVKKKKINTPFLGNFVLEGLKSGCLHQWTSLWQATTDIFSQFSPSQSIDFVFQKCVLFCFLNYLARLLNFCIYFIF